MHQFLLDTIVTEEGIEMIITSLQVISQSLTQKSENLFDQQENGNRYLTENFDDSLVVDTIIEGKVSPKLPPDSTLIFDTLHSAFESNFTDFTHRLYKSSPFFENFGGNTGNRINNPAI